jgi:hypothetical protein
MLTNCLNVSFEFLKIDKLVSYCLTCKILHSEKWGITFMEIQGIAKLGCGGAKEHHLLLSLHLWVVLCECWECCIHNGYYDYVCVVHKNFFEGTLIYNNSCVTMSLCKRSFLKWFWQNNFYVSETSCVAIIIEKFLDDDYHKTILIHQFSQK